MVVEHRTSLAQHSVYEEWLRKVNGHSGALGDWQSVRDFNSEEETPRVTKMGKLGASITGKLYMMKEGSPKPTLRATDNTAEGYIGFTMCTVPAANSSL
jgi:hypothetical protein